MFKIIQINCRYYLEHLEHLQRQLIWRVHVKGLTNVRKNIFLQIFRKAVNMQGSKKCEEKLLLIGYQRHVQPSKYGKKYIEANKVVDQYEKMKQEWIEGRGSERQINTAIVENFHGDAIILMHAA